MPLRLRLLPSLGHPTGQPEGPAAERVVELPDDADEINVGRRADLQLPLPFPSLSSLHARLVRCAGGGWAVEDMDSTNGTFVDGARVEPRQPRALSPGAHVGFARVSVIFEGSAAPITGAEGTLSLARRLVSDLFVAGPTPAAPTLAVIGGAPTGVLRLAELDRRYVIGRVGTADLPLPSDEVSREHAAFIRRWDGVVAIDLESKNGLRVNDQPAAAEHRLRDGDLIQIGPLTLRLSDPADRYLRRFERGADHADTPAPGPTVPPLATGPPPREQTSTQVMAAPARRLRSPREDTLVQAARGSRTSRAATSVAVIVLALIASTVVALALAR